MPSPREQEAYDALQCYTLALFDSAFVHQHVVDAWTAQHADGRTRPIALTFALIGLYLHLEWGFSGRDVQRAHMGMARRKIGWPLISLPQGRDLLTAVDVMAAPPGPPRNHAIDAWCASVWSAYRESRPTVVDFARRHGIVGPPDPRGSA